MGEPEIEIELKNYRGFGDGAPARFTIGQGLTALIGPNNSGKSSILKLFHELRGIWSGLADRGVLPYLATGHPQSINLIDVFDPTEIFTASNSRDMRISIYASQRLTSSRGIAVPEGIRVTIRRRSPQEFSVELLGVADGVKALHGDGLITVDGAVAADLEPWSNALARLAKPQYIGPFRNAINQGGGRHFGIDVGTSFIERWHEWMAGPDKAKNRKILEVQREIRRIFGFESLEIVAAKEWSTLQVIVNGIPFKLPELGAGLAEFTLLLGDTATREPSIVLIDEPELHLHPRMQGELLLSLGVLAPGGVVFATHSIGLARNLGDRIHSFQRDGDEIRVSPFVATPRYAEFLGEMSFSAYEELGAKRILLVEGVSDVRVFQVLLRLFGKGDQYVLVPLGGDQLARGDMAHELGELLRLTPTIRSVVDSERTAPGEPAKPERAAFEETCRTLGIPVLVTKRRAIENYLPQHAISAVKGAEFAALGDFGLLREAPRSWAKADNWRIALRMLREDLAGTDLGDFLAAC